jgi:hypothetical protein
MDRATAEIRLKRMVAWDIAPALSQDAINDLLDGCRRPDATGKVPSDPAWAETYDLNWAAWQGWEQKTSLASGAYNVATMGKTFGREALFTHCEAQAKSYRRKMQITSVPYGSRYY